MFNLETLVGLRFADSYMNNNQQQSNNNNNNNCGCNTNNNNNQSVPTLAEITASVVQSLGAMQAEQQRKALEATEMAELKQSIKDLQTTVIGLTP